MKFRTMLVAVCLIVVANGAFLLGVRYGQDFRPIKRIWPEGWHPTKFQFERVGPSCVRFGGRDKDDCGFTPILQSGFCPKDAPAYWQPRLMKEPVEEGG